MAERTTSAENTQNQHCQCAHTDVDTGRARWSTRDGSNISVFNTVVNSVLSVLVVCISFLTSVAVRFLVTFLSKKFSGATILKPPFLCFIFLNYVFPFFFLIFLHFSLFVLFHFLILRFFHFFIFSSFSLFLSSYICLCFSFHFIFFHFFISQPPPLRPPSSQNIVFPRTILVKARFWVREEEERKKKETRKKKKEERADRNKSPSTIARTGPFCYSCAWKPPSLRLEVHR